ncbi:MAG: aspartate kinase [Sphaerochaetaceae bacterium]|jgi:aspartate kinase
MTGIQNSGKQTEHDIVVCKFGGSSVADADHLKKVKAILDADLRRSVVVVSAPGKRSKEDEKVTDMLYACNKLVQEGRSCKELFKKVAKRYTDIASGLGMQAAFLVPVLDEVRRCIDAGYGTDYAASRGEYLSARLVAEFFGWTFVDTAQCVIINHDGTVHPATWTKLSEVIDPNGKYVVPGFYGATIEGVIKTFSRGGSDITGAIMSRAVDASLYENWTDVSGVFMADPRLIADAKIVRTMTYQEVRELAEVGAGVFHEEAIAPVMDVGIPINVKNTNDPSAPGTLIVPTRDSGDVPLVGVASRDGFSSISLHKMLLFKRTGIRHALLTMLHVFGIRPEFSLVGIDSIVWYYDSRQASQSVLDAMKARLTDEFDLDRISVKSGLAIVGVVGEGLMGMADLLPKATVALAKRDIPLEFLNYGASTTSCLFGVKSEYRNDAVQTLYKSLA